MTLQIQRIPFRGVMSPTEADNSRSLFRAIATDLHFWIPLTVLLGGFFLLDKLS